jgi:hypothetical protein
MSRKPESPAEARSVRQGDSEPHRPTDSAAAPLKAVSKPVSGVFDGPVVLAGAESTVDQLIAELRRQRAMRIATWPCVLLRDLMPLCDEVARLRRIIADLVDEPQPLGIERPAYQAALAVIVECDGS